jgi:hypothetical protein
VAQKAHEEEGMDEIAPDIWRWTARHPEWRTRVEWGHEVASFALVGDGLTLVDPLLPAPGTPARAKVDDALERLARDASRLDIMITIPYHARSAEELAARYRDALPTAVWGHRAVARRFTDPATRLHEIEPGRPVADVALALPIGKPRRFETPLYFADHRALAFGDVVIGFEGTLRVWQQASTDPHWHDHVFLPTMRPLLDLDVERVLVTHGPAVLHDGRAALREAMAAGMWDYPRHEVAPG